MIRFTICFLVVNSTQPHVLFRHIARRVSSRYSCRFAYNASQVVRKVFGEKIRDDCEHVDSAVVLVLKPVCKRV